MAMEDTRNSVTHWNVYYTRTGKVKTEGLVFETRHVTGEAVVELSTIVSECDEINVSSTPANTVHYYRFNIYQNFSL